MPHNQPQISCSQGCSTGELNPAVTHKTIVGFNNAPPHLRGGKLALSAEEGVIRNRPNRLRVTSEGLGAFDAELRRQLRNFQAMEESSGQIRFEKYKRIAYGVECIRGTAMTHRCDDKPPRSPRQALDRQPGSLAHTIVIVLTRS